MLSVCVLIAVSEDLLSFPRVLKHVTNTVLQHRVAVKFVMSPGASTLSLMMLLYNHVGLNRINWGQVLQHVLSHNSQYNTEQRETQVQQQRHTVLIRLCICCCACLSVVCV